MRDKFVGDVGDFGKYGLLRALCGKDLALGVVWYFVRDRMVDYLKDSERRFEECDGELFEVLRNLVDDCQRKTATIEASGLFPLDTVFFDDEVPTDGWRRTEWLDRALEKTSRCTVVFLDPDNGLTHAKPPTVKHVSLNEVQRFASEDKSVVIYHHLPRRKHDDEVKAWKRELRRTLDGVPVHVLRYRPYSPRAYFIIPTPADAALVDVRIRTFLSGPWRQHYERVV
jgi:hypothetical protein